MSNRLIAALIIVACAAAGAAAYADAGPFVGEWHWNQAESQTPPGETPPKDIVLKIASADVAHVQWTVTATDASGQQHVDSISATGDGKTSQITGSPPGTTRAFTVTPTSLQDVFIGPDGSSDRATCTVSPDRKKLTCRGVESDGKGHSANYVDVFDRR
jgi:hypothetical protein